MYQKIALGLAVIIALGLVYRYAIYPWYERWGASPAEIAMTMPGDDLVPGSVAQSTRAITIDAPAAAVYPWLLQMGQDRGGLYSYDALENLVGCNIHSVDRIVPELQNPVPGTIFRLAPYPTLPYYTYTLIIPDQAVILRSNDPKTGQLADGMWMFVLQPVDDHTTRLIVRHREIPPSGIGSVMMKLTIDPISFIMEQKMMRGIRDRTEAYVLAVSH